MKMKNKMIASAIALIGFAASSNAQVSATADAEATIVTPIAISKTADMNFGNVAVSTSAGTVVLAPATDARTTTGGITLPVVTGTVQAAAFTVSGQANYTYAITLPGSALTIENAAADLMTVGTFTSFPSATGTLSGAGSQTLKVGGTLNVAGSQAAGVYSSNTAAEEFTVTVNYN